MTNQVTQPLHEIVDETFTQWDEHGVESTVTKRWCQTHDTDPATEVILRCRCSVLSKGAWRDHQCRSRASVRLAVRAHGALNEGLMLPACGTHANTRYAQYEYQPTSAYQASVREQWFPAGSIERGA